MNDYGIPLKFYNVLDTKGALLVNRPVVGNCATTWIQLFRNLMGAFNSKGSEGSTICNYRYGFHVQDIICHDEKIEVRVTHDAGDEETLSADLVIGADGASSMVRSFMLPEVKRTYAGYVLLRGLVPTAELSSEAMRVMDLSATVCWNHNSQMLSYTVPARKDGQPDSNNFLNWGWYMEKTEEELDELMTDVDGRRHYYALPQGGMQTHLAEEIRRKARNELSPQFAEAVAKTNSPFVQVITDSGTPNNVFSNGSILLVGDAVGGQRPHTASSVTMACFHAHLLRLYLQGCVSLDVWHRETHFVSSTLVNAGQELGLMCLSTIIDPSDKPRLFVQKAFASQRLLAEKWKQYWMEE